MNAWKHFKTITRHRHLVMKGCFQVGLYRQGLTHDLSKFSPVEFGVGIRYFQGYRSPNDAERIQTGVSLAWLHHKGRNRHHFEYWIDIMGDPVNGAFGCKMPMKYVAEMVCDRRAACIAYHGRDYRPGDAYAYYERTKAFIIIHPDTRAVLEKALLLMRDEGEEACFAFLRKCLSITKGTGYEAGTF